MTPVQLPEVPAPVAECLVSGEYDDVTYPAVGTYYTADQLRAYATEAVMADRARLAAEVEVIAKEMRERLVNNRKHTSPTLVTWAERLTKITQPEQNSGR